MKERVGQYTRWGSARLGIVLGTCLLMAALPVVRSVGQPYPTPAPFVSVPAYVYDLEQRAGLTIAPPSIPSGPRTDIFMNGSIFYSEPRIGTSEFSPSSLKAQIGDPFDFRITVPNVGVYEGVNRVGYDGYYNLSDPVFIFPTTSERLGVTLEMRWVNRSPSPNGNSSGVRASMFVFNSSAAIGYGQAISTLSDSHSDRAATITVEYLPGCNLESLGRQIASYSNIHKEDIYQISVIWDASVLTQPWYCVRLGEIAPVGPIRVTLQVEGYQSDQVTIQAENLRDYYWNALLKPAPCYPDAPRPTGYDFHQTKDLSSPTLTPTPIMTDCPTSIPTPSPTPTLSPKDIVISKILEVMTAQSPPDSNHDGVIDVADIIRILQDAAP